MSVLSPKGDIVGRDEDAMQRSEYPSMPWPCRCRKLRLFCTPLPAGPIRKLRVTTAPTSSVTPCQPLLRSRTGGLGIRRNGLTIHKQRAKTIRFRTEAERAVQRTEASIKVVASQAINARDTLIVSAHVGCPLLLLTLVSSLWLRRQLKHRRS